MRDGFTFLPIDQLRQFTATEYRLLCELSVYSGRVMTYEQLLQRVWGVDTPSGSGPVRTIVRRLRQKLGDNPDSPTFIFNQRRVGYRMAAAET